MWPRRENLTFGGSLFNVKIQVLALTLRMSRPKGLRLSASGEEISHMWKYSTIILVLFSSVTLFGQNSDKPEAKLIRVFTKGDFLHTNNEAALDLREFTNGSEDKVAVRICSREPTPLALATASGRPFLLASNLTNHGYSPENILFLRAKNCKQYSSLIAITEFWAIPKGAALPPAVDVLKSSQVKTDEYVTKKGETKEEGFRRNLENLASKLRGEPRAVGIIAGYYLNNPSFGLKNNLQKAQRFFARSGLPKDRYFIRTLPWTGVIDFGDREPVYPAVMSVEVTKAEKSGATSQL
jgi:hypothetical protein